MAMRHKVESCLSAFVPQTVPPPVLRAPRGRQLCETDAKVLVLSSNIIDVPQMPQRMDLISDFEHIIGHSWDAFGTITSTLTKTVLQTKPVSDAASRRPSLCKLSPLLWSQDVGHALLEIRAECSDSHSL